MEVKLRSPIEIRFPTGMTTNFMMEENSVL
jgi:hypothetical protein